MWDKLWEAIQKYGGSARDARIGAVGADQVRELYKSNKQEDKELAKELNDKYLAANAAGISGGATAASALTAGVVPTLVSEVGGAVGGYAGNKAGSYLDEKLDTKWITPTLSIVGGLGSGIGSYKGLVNAGTKGLLKGNSMMYGKNFVSDVVATSLNKATKVPYKPTYGLVKWYGPTMGKTTAAKTNPNLVDFDDYIRPDLETLASKHGMNKQQLMMSQNPEIREEARQTMLKSIDGWKQNPDNASKTLVISKSDIIQDPIYNNTPIVLKKEEFLRRNAARGETDINNSLDWYKGTREKGGNTLLEWPDEQGVYISDIEPYVPDQHQITFTPKQPTQGTTSYKFYERPSKLSDAEKLGIPKVERNQPPKPKGNKSLMMDVVNGKPSKEFIDDFMKFKQAISSPTLSNKNAEAFQSMIELFDSPWYKQRLINQGIPADQIDAIVKNIKSKLDPEQLVIIDNLNAVRNFSKIDNGVPIGMSPERGVQYARISYNVPGLNKHVIQGIKNIDVDDVMLHEIGGHQTQKVVSDFKHLYNGQSLTSIGQNAVKKKQLPDSYYTKWEEIRARALTIAKQMADNGWNPNSPEQVNIWLNKHIFTNNPSNVNQGATYYSRPEFIKAVTTGLKQGGKLITRLPKI